MKMGEIRYIEGQFVMQTPNGDGIRPVTLRCDNDGVVHVEEVTDDGVSARPFTITPPENSRQVSVSIVETALENPVNILVHQARLDRRRAR